MREIRSYGSVGERGGIKPLYPEILKLNVCQSCTIYHLPSTIYSRLKTQSTLHLKSFDKPLN
jgi:hypothetical protein